MRILIITPSFPPQKCGVGDYTKIIAYNLAESGEEIEVVTLRNSKQFIKTNSEKYLIHSVIEKWDWSALNKIKSIIKASQPDWVNIQYAIGGYSNYHPMISFLPAFIKLWRLNCKIVLTIHEITPPKLFPNCPKFFNIAFGMLCTVMVIFFSDLIITCSDWLFIEIKKFLFMFNKYLKNRIHLIPVGSNIPCLATNDIDQIELCRKYNLDTKDFIICFFGFIRKGRGIETLVKAYKLLLEDGYKFRLLIMGGILEEQYKEEVQTLCRALEIDKQIIWTGMLSSKGVSVLLNIADVCVSINTPRGVSLNSGSFHAAATHGLPIITNWSRHPPEGLIDGENIIFINPCSEEDLKKAIIKLYNSNELRESIGRNIRAYSKKFTWEKIAERILDVIRHSPNHYM